LSQAIGGCGAAQRHKLLLTAIEIELVYGNDSLAPTLTSWALRITPGKSRPAVYILCAKVSEFDGDPEGAHRLFRQAGTDYWAEWRVFLEFAQCFLHQADITQAIAVLDEGLRTHPGSGRLWAVRVQLEAFASLDGQVVALKKAVEAVPKSGEVWCEAARMALNPLSPFLNLAAARKYLEFASRFTPQHGDSLIEMVRVDLLEKGPRADFQEIKQRFLCSEANYGLLFIFVRKCVDRPLVDVLEDSVRLVKDDIAKNRKLCARAIAGSAFVLGSIPREQEILSQMVAIQRPERFAFGLASVGELILDPSRITDKSTKLSIVLGSSGLGQ
jgi:hypothetical protein